jgi:hypothetical protein
MKFLILILSIFMISISWGFADSWKSLSQGDQLAQQFLNQSDQKKNEARAHPFYQGMPDESTLSGSGLKENAPKVAQKDEASQMVQTSQRTRPHFKIDPSKDPLLLGSQVVQKNPLQDIGGKGVHLFEVTQGGNDETLECEEPGEMTQHTCTETVGVTIKAELGPVQYRMRRVVGPVIRIKVKHGWSSYQHIETFFDPYQETIKTPVISRVNTCGDLETRVDRGHCSYVSRVCAHKGPQMRVFDGVSVTQDCWEETFTYACEHPSKDDCHSLRARGCFQKSSRCKQKIGNSLNETACVVYTQTYQCKGKSQTSYKITGGNTPFCLDGNCRDQSWEANDEMMASIAQLSILKAMEGKMDSIFKGTPHQCSKYIFSFKDCCGSGKGWGKKIGLGGCETDEKLLHEKRQKRLCHYVGTYCKKEYLGKCVHKKSSYCCFGSKLLKAFHVQGRPQIGLGWGTPKEPLCRGFTVEEIQRIDFSKIDLSEAFEDLMQQFQTGQNKSNVQGMGQQIGDRMESIQKGLKPPTEKQPPQRPEA